MSSVFPRGVGRANRSALTTVLAQQTHTEWSSGVSVQSTEYRAHTDRSVTDTARKAVAEGSGEVRCVCLSTWRVLLCYVPT